MDDSLLNELVRRKTLRFDAPVAASELVEGSVHKVVGTVRAAEEPLRAPFSGRSCVAFSVYGVKRGDDLVYRPSALEMEHGFWLDTPGAAVWIRPEGWVRYLVPPSRHHRTDPVAWRHYNAFADRYGVHYRETLGGFADGLEFLERAVEVGVRAAVVGEVTEPHFPSADGQRGGGYRDRVAAPSLWPPPSGRLWISTYEVHTFSSGAE